MSWNDEKVELLKKLWAQGLSCSQIANRLPGTVSRNAVIGKVTRLGLTGRDAARASLVNKRTRRKQGKKLWGMSNKDAQARRDKLPPIIDTPYVEPVTDETPRRTLATLEKDECRWPIGDPKTEAFGYCGCKRLPMQSYCETHHKRAYASVPVVRRKTSDDIPVPAGESVREREGVSQ